MNLFKSFAKILEFVANIYGFGFLSLHYPYIRETYTEYVREKQPKKFLE